MADRSAPPIARVRFEIHASPCGLPVVLTRQPGEPPEGFDAYVEAIKKRVRAGDKWAWCEVISIAHYGEYSGKSRTLQGVSVTSAEDFFSNHPQWEELRAEAYAALVANMAIDESTFVVTPRKNSERQNE